VLRFDEPLFFYVAGGATAGGRPVFMKYVFCSPSRLSGRFLKGALCVLFLLAGVGGPGEVARAQDSTYTLDVKGQPLGEALRTLVGETGLPLAYPPDLVAGRRTRCEATRGPAGRLLRCVLDGTGLRARRLSSGTYTLERRHPGGKGTAGNEAEEIEEARAQALVRGRITNEPTGRPIAGGSVQVKGALAGTAASDEGRYRIQLSAGRHVLRFGAVGHRTEEHTVLLELGEEVRLDVALQPEQIKLGQVTVESERPSPVPSTHRMSAESIRNAPALGLPDVTRTAALLPGVTQTNARRARLNVRGGAADQNLYLLDGVPVYQPAHLLGVFSAFNVEALSGATFYAGTFPARYGGRLSSVMDLQTKTARDSATTKANLSLISASAAATREFGDTSVMAAGRRAYLDLVLAAAATPLGYNFYDANLKVTHDLGVGWSAEAMGFLTRDASSAYVTATDGSVDSLRSRARWGTTLGALRLRYDGNRMSHQLTGSALRRFSDSRYPGGGDRLGTGFTDLFAQYDGEATVSENHLRFGLGYRRLRLDYGWQAQGGLELVDELFYPGLPAVFDTTDRAPLYSAYLSGERYLTSRLRMRGGLRYSNLGRLGGGVFSPRLDASYRVAEDVRLTASAGRYAQFMAEGTEGVALTVGEPLFLLRQPQRAWTYALGATGTLGDGMYQLSAEGYYRSFDNIARLAEDTEAVFPRFDLGDGRAFGLDVFLRKRRGWLTYQLGYSFLRARVGLGKEASIFQSDGSYPPRWSTPHTLQGLLGAKVGRYWKFTLAGTFRSGLPYTPVVGRFRGPGEDPGDLGTRFIPGGRNSERLSPYTRIDVSARRTYQSEWFDWTLYVQVMNLFNAANELRLGRQEQYFGNTQQESSGARFPARSLPILPSVGVELTF